MANSNACVSTQYLSGQGALLLAPRNPTTGVISDGFRPVGNVSALSITIETTEFEHTESCSGSRGIDLTIVQEINVSLTVTMESIVRDNLALTLFGETSEVAAGSAVDEIVAVESLDLWYPLNNIQATTIVVTGPAGSPVHVEGTDYICNGPAGSILPLGTGSIPAMANLEVDYDFALQDDVQAITSSTGAQRWARFEGLNTAEDPNTPVVVDFFKAQVQPLAELALINEEISQMEVEFNILSDPLQATTSKFFVIRKVGG